MMMIINSNWIIAIKIKIIQLEKFQQKAAVIHLAKAIKANNGNNRSRAKNKRNFSHCKVKRSKYAIIIMVLSIIITIIVVVQAIVTEKKLKKENQTKKNIKNKLNKN